MNDLPATRLNWRPTHAQWIGFGRAYCAVFETAMWAAAASDASRTLSATDSMGSDGKLISRVEAADRRVERAHEARAEKRPVAGFDNMDGEWTLKRCSADAEYEQAERDRIVSAHRAAEKTARDATTKFRSLVKNNKEVAGFADKHGLRDIAAWARKGRSWQLEIADLAQLLHERTMERQALEYRAGVVKAAMKFIAAIESPIDPQLRMQALGDIKRAVAMNNDEFDTAFSLVRLISRASYGATEYLSEAEVPFVGGSPWGQFVLNMRAFAKRNGLPHQPGGSTPGKNDRYGDLAEFLWAIQETLPSHLRSDNKKSTFVRKVKDAVKRGKDFALEGERLVTAEDESTTA